MQNQPSRTRFCARGELMWSYISCVKVNDIENDAIPSISPPEPIIARLLKKAYLRKMTKRDVDDDVTDEPLFERVFDAIFNVMSQPAEHTIATLLPLVGKDLIFYSKNNS